jgi:hypothetical protein
MSVRRERSLGRQRSTRNGRRSSSRSSASFNSSAEILTSSCADVEFLGHRNKGRASRIEDLDDLGKIGERAGQPVDLVDDHDVDPPGRDVGEQPLQSRPIRRRAGEPAVIISLGQACPTFVPLAGDEGFAGLARRLQRIEFLLELLFGGFAAVDRTGTVPFRRVLLVAGRVIGRPRRARKGVRV